MKKIFSTVAMAMVAFTAVVTMSSCQNDSPSSFNAAPTTTVPTSQTSSNSDTKDEDNTRNYYYDAFVSNDILSLFDVTIVRTAGSDVKTLTFVASGKHEGTMETGLDKVTADKNVEFYVKATFKLKANYKEILDKMVAERGKDGNFNTTIVPIYNIPVMGSTKNHMAVAFSESTTNFDELNEQTLTSMAEGYSMLMSKTNKQ